MQALLLFELLVLLTVANGAPVIAKKILGDRFGYPLDAGATFYDGEPVLGPTKTVRGIIASLLATALAAWLMRLGWQLGFLIAASAMAGDLFSSFVKRRMTMPSSSMALGLDHIPESLLPLLASQLMLPTTLIDILVGVAIFCAGALLLSPILYHFKLRDRPY